ncbi:MAG: hypothetical protein NPIRA03_04620 [Nitrospirales bacterium]|nr:MAG: hypothetical protein NPIRA03_04620 [Nitrospirales bacterium]
MKPNWAGISLYHTVLRQVGSEVGFQKNNEETMNKIAGKIRRPKWAVNFATGEVS